MAKKRIVKASTTKLGDSKTILGTFTGKCCDAAVFNNNSMKLDRELFEKLMGSDEYKDGMEHRYYIGFLGHPEDPNCQDFKDACIVMTSMEIKPNDEVYGTFDLIDTPVGRVVKTFIDAGVQFGISIRGAGDVDAEGNVDPDTFVFRGFDLVAFPAYNDAVPEFQIAASSDPKYKKIRAAIDTNLQYITSATAIEEIQANLNPRSAEYKKLEARKQDIGVQDEEDLSEDNDKDLEEITAKKLEAMTTMYMDECQKNQELEDTLASTRSELKAIKATYERKIKSLERITASQNDLMTKRLKKVTASYNAAVEATNSLKDELRKVTASKSALISKNSEITAELDKVNKNNLIYKQKIECSSADIEDRDTTISDLQKELDKTVVASTAAKREASNRDEEVKQLKSQLSSSSKTVRGLESRITACEEMLFEYQQAFADFYATALGTSVSGLPISASTSVDELKNLIQGATNTSNIGEMPDYGYDEDFVAPEDIVDGENDNNLATL